MGHSLYRNGVLANPFQTLDTGPTAHTAPGFPVLVAAIYRVFGDGAKGAYALKMTEATAILLQIALLPVLMQVLGTSLLTGLLAALFAVMGVRRVATWEANYVGLLLMFATLAAFRYYAAIRKGGIPSRFLRSPQSIAWLLGFLWAAILLTGPSAGAIWIAWLICGAWLSWRHGFRYAWLPVLIVPLLAAVPWEWRDYKLFHAMVPIRDSFGLELRISNNPCAKVTLWQNRHGDRCYAHPNEDVGEAMKVAALGEVAYNRRQEREAVEWIEANPRSAISLWTQRFKLFWVPPAGRQVAMWTIVLLTPLSLIGLFFLARSNPAGAVLLGSFMAVYPLLYYLIQASERYRFPILWVTFGLGAIAVAALAERALTRVPAWRNPMTGWRKNLPKRIAMAAAYVALSLGIAGVFFFLFEGISSFVLLANKALEPQAPLAEKRYTKYDAQLGWVNLPSFYVRDLYGPGAYLRTNARGFRNDAEVSASVPPGRIRVICSGDSFTLGYGVANDRTWCQDLAAIDRRLETVNMGQGGYGLDQAYLWYARDGVALNHDVHIFAFIGSDLRRMASDTFEGYPKPTLGLEAGRLVTKNVPVPRVGASGRFVQRLMVFRDLQSVVLTQRILFRRPLQSGGAIDPSIFRIANRVFDRLAELNREKDSELIVTFLPTEGEYRQGMPDYVAGLKKDVEGKGIAWIDLVDDFRKVSPEQARRLFITEADVPQFKTASGHYTVEGNAFAARLLYERMARIPAIAAKLERLPNRRDSVNEALASR